MIANSLTSPKDSNNEDRPLTSNEIEKVLELQNSVMLRRRLTSNFGYPDFGYRPGLNPFADDHENAGTVYEQQKLIQNLLKHYQTTLMDEASPWLNSGSLLYPKREEIKVEDDTRRKDDGRKKYKRDEEGKVFAKQRKTNFTAKEVETLLKCVADQKEVILFGVAGGKGWAKAWQEIAKVVTKAEGIDRTEGDVRKKWTYLKWEAKNTSKPGRDPVSKHVLNILTSRDREVAEAMNLRSNVDSFPKEVQPGGPSPIAQMQSPASSPLPTLHGQQSPQSQMTKKIPLPTQPMQKLSSGIKDVKHTPKPPAKPQPPPEVCLRWNSYHSNMQNTFPSLLNNEQFVDVTLACDGRSIKCHKVMLSACSPYMEELLSANPCQHPIIFLKDMKFWQLAALVDFMYRGEVNVTQDKLPSLLSAAEALQIKGLASPVHPTSPPRPMHEMETSDSMSLLSQFKSEIKTEMDEEYMQDTDDSIPETPKPKKRKIGDTSNSGTSGFQVNGKKSREQEQSVDGNLNPALPSHRNHPTPPTHHAPPPGQIPLQKQPSTDPLSASGLQELCYQNFPIQRNHGNSSQSDDLNIDEEQAQIILERYTQQDENYSRDGDDYSNGSG